MEDSETEFSDEPPIFKSLLQSKFSYGLIVFGSYESIKTFQRALEQTLRHTGLKLVFQRISADRLWIVKRKEARGDE